MSWWSDWLIPLLIVSGVLLIFKGGLLLTILLWAIYLLNGSKTVNALPSDENKSELGTHILIGGLVIIFSIAIRVASSF